ncbi:MAG: phage holin family protein [Bacteroidota bacterium]|nr:phage holin family protein [Bacteroidota bacterium]
MLIRLITSSFAVIISSFLLPGVQIKSLVTAVLVSIVLGFLNAILKPILVILTIPITIFTLGLFLVVINAIMIMIAGSIVPGFFVAGFGSAFLFSLIMTFVGYVFKGDDGRRR